MNEKTGYIFDVNEQEFEQRVIQASVESVIIVDFWENQACFIKKTWGWWGLPVLNP